MPAKPRVSQIVTVPAPIQGWNVRDPLPTMAPTYAPTLDNCFCLPSELQVRKGYEKWATFTGICQTVMDYSPPSGNQIVIGAVKNGANCYLYDMTAQGTVGAALVSGLSSALFKHANFSTSGGNFAYYVNGVDNALLYDGTTWRSITTVSAPYAITGVTNTQFKDVVMHKRRLWFVPNDSMSLYYLPTDQISGAASKFDLTPIFSRGGQIVKIATWTLDAGIGVDDYFVIFTSEGEVAIYTGTDPASASTWSLQGVFYIGTPTGLGHTCKYGGDLLIINKDGVAQMSKSLMSSRVNTWLQLTDKIQPQLAKDTSDYAANEGWDILLFPPANMLLINIPTGGTTFYQYVMNTISGAWARWTSLEAYCWYFVNENLWFGSNGYLARAWVGQNDAGAAITADIIPAYQNFGAASQLKRWSLGRALIGTTANVAFGARMETDFAINSNEFTLPVTLSTPTAVYGTAKYGSAVYDGNFKIKQLWKNVSGIGYWGSLHVKLQTTYSDTRFYSYDLAIESGGNL